MGIIPSRLRSPSHGSHTFYFRKVRSARCHSEYVLTATRHGAKLRAKSKYAPMAHTAPLPSKESDISAA